VQGHRQVVNVVVGLRNQAVKFVVFGEGPLVHPVPESFEIAQHGANVSRICFTCSLVRWLLSMRGKIADGRRVGK